MKFKGVEPETKNKVLLVLVLIISAAVAVYSGSTNEPPAGQAKITDSAKPALTVTLIKPETQDWPRLLLANGNVVAWQEAIISPEIANYRITEIHAQVGDRVKKGQVLARIDSGTVASELAEAQAAVAELEATAAEAKNNRNRSAELIAKGFYSKQLDNQYQTTEQTVLARLDAARARHETALIKMNKTSVRAPDDGVISARSIAVGTLTQPGNEAFRLIRGGRLEWRAEVPSADLAQLRPGVIATLTGPAGESVQGKVRAVAPSVDPATRNGLVYVDLPPSTSVRAGMFARGEFELGRTKIQTLPQAAVVLREGFAYIFRLDGERVAQTKVTLGRRQGERLEIIDGLLPEIQVVAKGAGFLADGDRVKVVSGETR